MTVLQLTQHELSLVGRAPRYPLPTVDYEQRERLELLHRGIEHCGCKAALARELGIDPCRISRWVMEENTIPEPIADQLRHLLGEGDKPTDKVIDAAEAWRRRKILQQCITKAGNNRALRDATDIPETTISHWKNGHNVIPDERLRVLEAYLGEEDAACA